MSARQDERLAAETALERAARLQQGVLLGMHDKLTTCRWLEMSVAWGIM